MRLVWTLLAIALVAVPSRADEATGPLPAGLVSALDQGVEAARRERSIPGLSVAVAWRGQIVYSRGFGQADVEHAVAATADTVYRTASVAKPMTATAVLQLAGRGKLDLDAPVRRYCSALPERGWDMTARQLLAHIGGVRHYVRAGEHNGTQHYWDVRESLALFTADGLVHEPGTRFLYSTYAYTVLGCAIEGAAGEPYETYMQQNVWGPAGMTRTAVDDQLVIIPGRARGYRLVTETLRTALPGLKPALPTGTLIHAALADTSMKVPGGGLVSTAVDLARFGAAVASGKLLEPALREAQLVPQKTRDGVEIISGSNRVGLGWFLREAHGTTAAVHTGGQAGATCVLYVLPPRDLAVAVMTNLEDAPTLPRLASTVAATVLGVPEPRGEAARP